MGVWGVELFSDDRAADVRAYYRELIEDGVEDAEATRQVMEHFQEYLDDEDDGPVVWLALAVSQSQVGRLIPEVRDKALSVIETGADLERWTHDPAMWEQRHAVLPKTRQQLLNAQPSRKRIRRPRVRYVTDLQPGDVLSFRASNGRFALVRVTRLDPDRSSVAPIVKVLRYADQSLAAMVVGRLAPRGRCRDRLRRGSIPSSDQHRPKAGGRDVPVADVRLLVELCERAGARSAVRGRVRVH